MSVLKLDRNQVPMTPSLEALIFKIEHEIANSPKQTVQALASKLAHFHSTLGLHPEGYKLRTELKASREWVLYIEHNRKVAAIVYAETEKEVAS